VLESSRVLFRRFDEKSRLPNQHKQVRVAGNQNIGISALREVQKNLILPIQAKDRTGLRWIDQRACGRVKREHFQLKEALQAKFSIGKHTPEFGNSGIGSQRYHPARMPVLTQPAQTAGTK